MTTPSNAVLVALAEAALDATGAAAAWIVVPRTADGSDGDSDLDVVVVAGAAVVAPGAAVSSSTASGAAYVLTSGQPLAVRPAGTGPVLDTDHPLVAAAVTSVCAVPCDAPDGVVGVLELVDKADARAFTIDDVEVVAMLARVAAVALLADDEPAPHDVPDPAAISVELTRLQTNDPILYRRTAHLVTALLAYA